MNTLGHMSCLVVFDTNIFVSYFWTLNKPNTIKTVVDQIRVKKIVPVYSDEIMIEYREVLGRQKFHFRQDEVLSFLKLIRDKGLCVNPTPTTVHFSDTSDKPFYEAAVAAGCWLVTGNKRHYPDEHFVVSPREYIERVGC